jgi:uncharacterized cupredoxin-like copper-binding protein
MTKFSVSHAIAVALVTLAVSIPISGAQAQMKHGGGQGSTHGSGHEAAEIGAAGDPSQVDRTVEIVMHDNYYEPETISVEEGETVRFVVKNAGEFVHEFNIATAEMHRDHQPEMMMMVEHGVLEADRINMEAAAKMQASMGHGMHDAANSVLLEPGKTGEVIWTFGKSAELEFACNIPGHYEAGMMGQIKLSH